ncbi:hypothetical protein VE03_07017 [Pseudogymnoascus sp. 23342-1-I1]|nr:hypothetical protein VE03_07017 [Pseudogymnoascus sp. 23342-1-I1]
MHINLHPRPRPLSVHASAAPYRIVPRQNRGLVEMTNSEFNSLSGAGAAHAGTGGMGDGSGCDWDTTTTGLEGIFQDSYSNPPFSLSTPAPAFGGAYIAFPTENSGSNAAAAAGRGFETQPLHQQQQFSTQMLSYPSKFVPRPTSSFQVSQSQQGNEYWNSLATSTSQNNNWKMDYNNNSNNNILMDFGKCGYDEFSPLPLQTGRLGSFALCSGSDTQSPDDVLHFSPNYEGQDFPGKRTWSNALKQHEQTTINHGLTYDFYDDTSANTPLSIFPPGPEAHWNETTHVDTVSPKALTLSSSSVSFSGSSSSDCGSIDSVSTTDGFLFQSAGDNIQSRAEEKQEMDGEVKVRHKLPERPVRQYIAIAPSVERTRQVLATRTGEREAKVCFPPLVSYSQPPSQCTYTSSIQASPSPPPITVASRNPRTRHDPFTSPTPMTRITKDAFLISSKQAGMSYRAIRQAGNFSEAESTLRGRYRTLTKQKEERVRKPEWTAGDVALLREAVERFRCCERKGGRRGRGGKTPWKRVAEYIEGNGGSYRFGNATCRKMWDRLGEEEEEG